MLGFFNSYPARKSSPAVTQKRKPSSGRQRKNDFDLKKNKKNNNLKNKYQEDAPEQRIASLAMMRKIPTDN